MQEREEERARQAAGAEEDEIARFLHDPSPVVIKTLLANSRLTEQDVLIIARRKNLPGDVLEALARDKRWSESYPIRLALARNPKTPLIAALANARGLRLFDLAELAGSPLLPMVFRHKIEAVLVEKIPTVALGLKRSLAKTVSGGALLALMKESDNDIITACLNNPRLTEAHLYKLISREDTRATTIQRIAGHPNWSSRYTVRLALVRNRHTPLARCVEFFPDLRTIDLRNLFGDPTVPNVVRPYLHQELLSRGEQPEDALTSEEILYEINEEESSDGTAG